MDFSSWARFLQPIIDIVVHVDGKYSLYRMVTPPNFRVMLDEMFQRIASKLAIIYMYEHPKLHLPFFISCNFMFLPNANPGPDQVS